jgi:hypothetical protein
MPILDEPPSGYLAVAVMKEANLLPSGMIMEGDTPSSHVWSWDMVWLWNMIFMIVYDDISGSMITNGSHMLTYSDGRQLAEELVICGQFATQPQDEAHLLSWNWAMTRTTCNKYWSDMIIRCGRMEIRNYGYG